MAVAAAPVVPIEEKKTKVAEVSSEEEGSLMLEKQSTGQKLRAAPKRLVLSEAAR